MPITFILRPQLKWALRAYKLPVPPEMPSLLDEVEMSLLGLPRNGCPLALGPPLELHRGSSSQQVPSTQELDELNKTSPMLIHGARIPNMNSTCILSGTSNHFSRGSRQGEGTKTNLFLSSTMECELLQNPNLDEDAPAK